MKRLFIALALTALVLGAVSLTGCGEKAAPADAKATTNANAANLLNFILMHLLFIVSCGFRTDTASSRRPRGFRPSRSPAIPAAARR